MDDKNTSLAIQVARHYGYDRLSTSRGIWKNEPGVLHKIALLPEAMDEKKKCRVIIDYDPAFSRVLVQIFDGQTSRQGQPCGNSGDFVKSSELSQ